MDIPKYSINNILVVQIGKLGDMVLATPLFHELKRLYPHSKLTVLASESNFDFAKSQPVINNVIVYKKNFFSLLRLLFTLKNKHFDLWIDPKNEKSDTSAFLVKYAKPAYMVGYNFDKKAFDIDLSGKEVGKHAVDIYMTPMKALNPSFESLSNTPVIEISDEVKENVKSLLEGSANNIFINLSAGQQTRYWSIDKWIEVVYGINELGNYTFLLNTHGLNETGQNKLKSLLNVKLILLDHLSQLELAEAIRNSKAVISPDTSAIHIASAFNIPVIDLMTNVPWNTERFAPLSGKQKILISNDENSLDSITPDQVITAFNELNP